MTKECIIICGMHRSGTSALAGTLKLCGYYLGKNLIPSNEHNPLGHFENKAILDLNEDILSRLNASWYTPVFNISKKLEDKYNIFFPLFQEIISSEFSNKSNILIKDPRISILLPFYLRSLEDLKYNVHIIICYRKPTEIAKSLLRRDHLGFGESGILYSYYLTNALHFSSHINSYIIDYADLLEKPTEFLHSIKSHFDLKFQSAIDFNITNFINKKLKHQHDNKELLELLPNICLKVYDALKKGNSESLFELQQQIQSYLEHIEEYGIINKFVNPELPAIDNEIILDLQEQIKKAKKHIFTIESLNEHLNITNKIIEQNHIEVQADNRELIQQLKTNHNKIIELKDETIRNFEDLLNVERKKSKQLNKDFKKKIKDLKSELKEINQRQINTRNNNHSDTNPENSTAIDEVNNETDLVKGIDHNKKTILDTTISNRIDNTSETKRSNLMLIKNLPKVTLVLFKKFFDSPAKFIGLLTFKSLFKLINALRVEPIDIISNNLNNKFSEYPIFNKPIPTEIRNTYNYVQLYLDEFFENQTSLQGRGWIFTTLDSKIENLTIRQEDHSQRSTFKISNYGIKRPDVAQYFNYASALNSGFTFHIPKLNFDKSKIYLDFTIRNIPHFIILTELEFSILHDKLKGEIEKNQSKYSKLKRKNSIGIYLHSKGNHFFTDIQDSLFVGFSILGYDVFKLNENDPFDSEFKYNIIIAPHEFYYLNHNNSKTETSNIVIYNTEQTTSKWYELAYTKFQHAIAVWDISYKSYLINKECFKHTMYIPPGFIENSDVYSSRDFLKSKVLRIYDVDKLKLNGASYKDRYFDVFFVGHASARRQAFLAKNAEFFAKKRCFIHLTNVADGPVTKGGENYLDKDLAKYLIKNSKILLNIHHSEVRYFEWHRIAQLGINNKTLVISETTEPDMFLEPEKHFIESNLDMIPDKIEEMISDWKNAEIIINRAYDQFSSVCRMENILKSNDDLI